MTRLGDLAYDDLRSEHFARAASTTGVPNTSPSSNVTSPRATPTRTDSGTPAARAWRWLACWIATASSGRARTLLHQALGTAVDLGLANVARQTPKLLEQAR